MNHYPHHIGDWMRDTAHLSEIEECYYSRLIDQYYIREKPLPAVVEQCCRLVRATTAPARKVVASVLAEFFVLQDDGWHQKRCDEEVIKFHEGDAEREHREANERERSHRHREERTALFVSLRLIGIVPKWDTSISQLRALACNGPVTRTSPLQEQTGNAPVTDQERPCNGLVTANQNQNQNHIKRVGGKPPKTRLPNGFGISDRVRDWAADKGYDRLGEYLEAFLGKVASGGLTYADWDAGLMNSIREDWGKVRERQPKKERAGVPAGMEHYE